ncbi:hypothetical protein ABZ208_24635 [Streptomyces sp. NPDC006208]|uniref:hypothetical protein n=1 Tax=Streptomyces sp. NPDC006208 TaxID=3156734 RepID=UPI0033AB18AD
MRAATSVVTTASAWSGHRPYPSGRSRIRIGRARPIRLKTTLSGRRAAAGDATDIGVLDQARIRRSESFAVLTREDGEGLGIVMAA